MEITNKEKVIIFLKDYNIILMMILFAIGFLFNTIFNNDVLKTVKDYPLLNKRSAISGIIKHKRVFEKGGARLILENGEKLLVINIKNNLYGKKAYLELFLRKNDSITKKAFNDSLFVHRNNKEYYFIITGDNGSDN